MAARGISLDGRRLSESCALTSVSAEFIRDIEPGEILTITKDGLKSNKELASAAADDNLAAP